MTDPQVALERAQQRQAAMAEVLQIISRSAFDLRAVLESVIERASRLCRAQQGFMYRLEGDWYRLDVAYNITPEFLAFTERTPIHAANLGTLAGRVGQARRAVQIPDVLQDPDYTFWEAHRLGKYRAMLGVPLIREERVLGVIVLWRAEPEPFTDDEAQLVSIFADQAVVAIEQARLVRALQRQTEELSRYVTPQVASLIASEEGEALLAGHRRQITAMFCDLRGFSTFSETAEPEEVFSVLREYQAGMGQLIAHYGGTLEHLAGDGIMVFFNDPVSTPGYEAQTIRCAVGMRERFRELAGGWRRRGYQLDLGIGIALGYATLGRVGYEGHFQYNATGNVVILASRLSGEAKGGEILISQRLYAAVEDLVDVDPVRDVTLKGFSRPVSAINVIGLKT